MKKLINTIKENKKLLIFSLIIGIVIGLIISSFTGTKSNKNNNETEQVAKENQQKKTIWTCSMHPQIREEEPGKCPICGMDLIPLNEEISEIQDTTENPDELQLSEEAIALAQIQTIKVVYDIPVKELYLFGKVAPNERSYAQITARFSGRIEKLYINYTGQSV